MALKKVKGNLERMFDKNLTDLAKYITQCVEEIKQELRQDNIAVKSNAVAKLTYLQMLGYDISWAAFNIIEVMSSSKFTYKRVGYLAAAQCFHEGTEVLMLTTNMIRKDLNSQNQYDAGTALMGLSCFITPDLARDLANDILTLLSSTKPYLRKKAVLILFKVFLKFPEALKPAFARLKEKLEDPDAGVQSASVNVVCELARKNPKNYLSLAPIFFKLMTSSSNNWMLIKIIKLFGALTPLEPRLGKKLIEPLTNLIHSTSAMSLLYECINTVIAVLISISSGMPNHDASIQLCVQKLRILIEDSDQNLKYLGLLAMSKILKTHPKSVQTHKDLVLGCLDDKDESIRLRALDLIYGMVTKKNLMEIVKKLMLHMDKAEGTSYRDELLSKIVEICCQNNYQFVTNFEWYVSILVELTQIEGTRHGNLIACQMLDVAIRVQAIRPFAVSQMASLLANNQLLSSNAQRSSICEVLYAAAWICGEFSILVPDPRLTLESMLRSKVTSLPGHIQSVYVQNVMKLYARILTNPTSNVVSDGDESSQTEVQQVSQILLEKLPMFEQSADLEVQERACCMLQLMKYITKLQAKGEDIADEVAALFIGELNPVAPKAQRKVPLVEGLDLNVWINEPPSESSEEDEPVQEFLFKNQNKNEERSETKRSYQPSEEELEKMRQARKLEQASNPHYLKSYPSKMTDSTEDIPVAHIDLSVPLHVPGFVSSDKYLLKDNEQTRKKRKQRRNKKGKNNHLEEDSDEPAASHVVNTDAGEMPEGAKSTDEEDGTADDPHRALDIDLEEDATDVIMALEKKRNAISLLSNHEVITAKKSRTKKHSREHKEKKKKKTKKIKNDDLIDSGGHDLIEGHDNEMVETAIEEINKNEVNDIDFWLTPNEPITKKVEKEISEAGDATKTDEVKLEKTKVKKEKKKTKHESKRKKKIKKYEEALGICTPSQEEINQLATPTTPSCPPMTHLKLLAEDKYIRLLHEARVFPNERNEVLVILCFSSIGGSHLKEIEFNVLDTLNMKFIRGSNPVDCGIKIPFQLAPGASNEAQFAFSVDEITTPQKLRGTLTYMVMTSEGSTHEKLDFTLPFPSTTFLLGSFYKRDTFAELLSSGDLSHKSSVSVDGVELEFSHVLARICFRAHFCLVEQVELTASLYSRSIQDHHICLLVKLLPNNQIRFDGKSTHAQLLSNVLDEIKSFVNISNH
uniref:AP-3 complex subunit delta n=1 Tax=Strigamia maritima TaxID=126957 RepID=T1J3E7_STRMM